jgi:hypothetical protein
MGEKRGNTGKLEYDFNTAWACEIQLPSGNWCRTLETNFRSYNGPRRITKPVRVELGNPFVGTETYEYEGPVYYYKTNTFCNPEAHPKNSIVHQTNTTPHNSKRNTPSGL